MVDTQTPLGNLLATSRHGVLLTAGFAVTIAAILFSMWVAYDNLRIVRESRDQVMSSRQIITELASVMSTMKDAETGQRGYVITGEQEYLEPYETAIRSVHQHVAALKTLTADDPQQRASLTTLETHITRKLGELENTIALRRGKGPDAARSTVKTGLGHQAMNDIRRLVAEMQEVEGRTLAQRNTNEERSYKRGFSSSLLAGLLALGVAIAAYVLLRRDTVARQQAQNALRLSAQQLREASDRLTLAQQAARVGSFEWNIQTNLNTWTPELETLYGLSPGTFGGTMEDWIQRLHVDDRKAVLEANRKAVESCGEFSAEFRIVWPDGSIHWMSGRAKVITDDAGRALRLVGVNIDITERKQAEELLRRNERNL
ncbi:MAG TPA: CHASE3 domain-containing protein, partial [Nitrospira sp.]